MSPKLKFNNIAISGKLLIFIFFSLILFLTFAIIYITNTNSKQNRNFSSYKENVYSLGQSHGFLNIPLFLACHYPNISYRSHCVEGYFSSKAYDFLHTIDFFESILKEPLFYQRLAAMGLGQGLSHSNLDLQQGLSRLKKTGQLEKLIPYLIEGWSFDKNLKALGTSNSDICEKIPFKYADYCYFGAGRAHYFRLRKPITTRWQNTGGINKNFLRGWGFATGFNQNHPVTPPDFYF